MRDLIDGFLRYCAEERHLSPRTIRCWTDNLRLFARYVGGLHPGAPLAAVTSGDLREWLRTMPVSASTKGQRLTTVRRLYAFAHEEGQVTENLAARLPLPKIGHRVPETLTHAEMAAIFQSLDRATDWLITRDRAIIELLYGAGPRATEVTDVDQADLNLDEGTLLLHGKGARERVNPLGPPVVAALRAYEPLRVALSQIRRRPTRGEPVFMSYEGQRLTRDSLGRLVRERVKASGFARRFHLHMLRHTFATHMHDAGADIRDIQVLLGHANITTTQIYTEVSAARRRQVLLTYHPRLQLLQRAG